MPVRGEHLIGVFGELGVESSGAGGESKGAADACAAGGPGKI